jgi:hypothetical protein
MRERAAHDTDHQGVVADRRQPIYGLVDLDCPSPGSRCRSFGAAVFGCDEVQGAQVGDDVAFE